MTWHEDPEIILCRLFTRWYKLRKVGLCEPLIYENGVLYKIDGVVNPWFSKTRISQAELLQMIEEGEREYARKPMGRESGERGYRTNKTGTEE